MKGQRLERESRALSGTKVRDLSGEVEGKAGAECDRRAEPLVTLRTE